MSTTYEGSGFYADATTLELQVAIAEHLRTIARDWWATSDPMMLGDGRGGSAARLPGPTIELRADVTGCLAFWVHAMVDEWPSVLQHLEHSRVPHPTTDPNHYAAWQEDGPYFVVTDTIDCRDVPVMATLLSREATRIAEWERFGSRMADELRPLANAVRQVAKPPKRETVTVGDCHSCGQPVKVRLTQAVPQPTTDPDVYHLWTAVPSTEAWATVLVRHSCGVEMTLADWHKSIAGPTRPMPAELIVEELHARLGVRYSAITLRTWSKRGLVRTHGYTKTGHGLYDLHEVMEVLVRRDATREEMARGA